VRSIIERAPGLLRQNQVLVGVRSSRIHKVRFQD
jgi:hypothetical protein